MGRCSKLVHENQSQIRIAGKTFPVKDVYSKAICHMERIHAVLDEFDFDNDKQTNATLAVAKLSFVLDEVDAFIKDPNATNPRSHDELDRLDSNDIQLSVRKMYDEMKREEESERSKLFNGCL